MRVSDFYHRAINAVGGSMVIDAQGYSAQVGSPIVMDRCFLTEWLALNYLYGFHFLDNGIFIMSEFGGTVLRHRETEKLVLAISAGSIDSVLKTVGQIQEQRKQNYFLKVKSKFTKNNLETMHILSGNTNIINYDFVTYVYDGDIITQIRNNPYFILKQKSIEIVSKKELKDELYFFHVPYNQDLFRVLKGNNEGFEQKLKLLKENKSKLLISDFIYGFYFLVERNWMIVKPIISDNDCISGSSYFSKNALVPEASELFHFGKGDKQNCDIIDLKLFD